MSDLEARIAETLAATDKTHAFRAADYSDRERPTFRCSCGVAATGKYHEHFNGELTAALAPLIREREAEAWAAGVVTALNHAILNKDGITLRLEHLDGRPWANPYRSNDE